MEPGDGYQEHYPAMISNNFGSIQIIARKRRRSTTVGMENSPECNHQHHNHNHQHATRGSCSNSGIHSSFLFSSSLVVLLFSLLIFLCLVPHTSCLPYGDGGHRSQLDLLIDPIHQAEYDDSPLESKRIVAKSVFDMVLRTPPPPTSSSSRCPPGTQSPFEGGPCIKKSTEPVATVDEVFLLDTLRGLANKGVLLPGPSSSSRPKRPGGGRRRPSGRPGSRPRTTQEPSSTTPSPAKFDEESNEVPQSTILSADDEQIALTTGLPPTSESATVITTQKIYSMTTTPASVESSSTQKQSLPVDAETTIASSAAVTATDAAPMPEQEKFGQVYLDNSEPTTSQRMTANSASAVVIDKDQVSPESATDAQSEYVVTTPETPSSSSSLLSSVRPTFTEQELTVDVITKDGTDKDSRESASIIPVTITPSPSASPSMKRQVAEGADVTVDMSPTNEMEQSTSANKDDIMLTHPTVSPTAPSQNQGDISEAISTLGPEQEDAQASFMSNKVIRFDIKEPPVLIQSLDQGQPKSPSASLALAGEKPNQRPGHDGSLILDEKVTTPSSPVSKESPEESKRSEEKRVLVLITKDDVPKRPLKLETEAGLVSSAENYEIEAERQVPLQQQAETTTTATIDVSMTGRNREEEAVAILPRDHEDDQRNIVIENEGDDDLPSRETSRTTPTAAVNHLGAMNGGTVMPVKHEDSDLLIINNPSISPVIDAEDNNNNKDGGATTSPLFIVKEKSPSSREETFAPEQIEDFTMVAARDQPVLNEKDVDPLPQVPATTLLPPTTIPASPSAFKDEANSGSLLQFQLPIVTNVPSSKDNANGFEKFPEFPPVSLPLPNENSGQIRFPSGEENLVPVPAEAAPNNNDKRGTFRPILIQDFHVDFPTQEEETLQEWQSPKPFPQQQTSSPSPIPNDPIQIQTSQPELFDTGSTEYLESELDRRHQKTRSRNRIRYPETTNSPLPPDLVFYSPQNFNLRPTQSHTPTPKFQQQQHHHIPQQYQRSEQPYFFARRNPSSEYIPFGYLNFRSGHGLQDRFNGYNNRRLFR